MRCEGASHVVDYISVHIRFDLERYLLIILIVVVNWYNVAAFCPTGQETYYICLFPAGSVFGLCY